MSRYTLEVDLGDRSYPIHIGEGLLSQADLFKPHVAGKVAMICTNTTVGPLYADRLKTSLLDAGAKSVFTVSLPDGEEYKDWPNLQLVFDAFLQYHCDRKTVLVALGGGKFEVAGQLTIKGTARDVVVPVALSQSGTVTTATGTLPLKRLAFKIGENEWADTSMVADDVQVKFKLALSGVGKL